MALMRCPDCRTKVSDRASFCPKCGRAYTNTDRERERKINELKWKIGLPLVGLFLLFGQCDKKADEGSSATSGSALTTDPIPSPTHDGSLARETSSPASA